MKRLLCVLLSFAVLFLIASQSASALLNETEKSAFEKCSKAFHKLISEYDNGEYISDIVLDETDGIKINGNDFSIPAKILIDNCAEDSSFSAESKTVDRKYAESLGYEIIVNDDSVILSQPYQTHRLIVKGENIDELDALEVLPYFDGMFILQFDDLKSTLAALEYYKKRESIDFADPDSVVSVIDGDTQKNRSDSVDGLLDGTSWGSDSIGFNTAFKKRMGSASSLPTVKVGVIDTGVSLKHIQIKSRIIETGYNTSGTGTDDSEADDNGHGTHIAGIIAQNTLSNVKIMGYKAFNKNGTGTIAKTMDALYAAYYDGVRVVNISASFNYQSASYASQKKAYSFLANNNVSCCVSAGNDGKDCNSLTPAMLDECITVAAMDINDEIPDWSNYGKCVDIIAPGDLILSADYSNILGYVYMSGTSMAAPFASAAVANITSKNSEAKPKQIKEFLIINGREINAPEEFYDAPALYIGNIKSFDMLNPEAPVFSVESGTYTDSITVSLTADDDTDIYYDIWDYQPDGKYIASACAIKYSEPIEIKRKCNLVAVCKKNYKNTTLESETVYKSYFFEYTNPEDYFIIDENGVINEYSGTQNDVFVPDSVSGITVTAIGNEVFKMPFGITDKETNYLRTIRLPETCMKIGKGAFESCYYLSDVYFDGTESEWQSVEIGNNNEYLKKAEFHYLKAEPELISFDGVNAVLIDSNGKTSKMVFAEYINDYCRVLDVVEDGVINAKDFAYLIKNYS